MIQVKRVYEDYDASEGKRVLVDRLWPRGLTKDKAGIDVWLKDIAPSAELRKWFNHDPAKWPEFKKRFHKELDHNKSSVDQLKKIADSGKIVIVYGAKDQQHNNAVVIAEYLNQFAQ